VLYDPLDTNEQTNTNTYAVLIIRKRNLHRTRPSYNECCRSIVEIPAKLSASNNVSYVTSQNGLEV